MPQCRNRPNDPDSRSSPAATATGYVGQIGRLHPPLLTAVYHKGDLTLRFFSTITTFGTPQDVTLEELRIECSFPVDEATAKTCRGLADS